MFRNLFNFLLDLVYPRTCLSCGQIDTWLCIDCQVNELNLNLKEIRLPHCINVDRLWCLADFEDGIVKKLVKSCKYDGVIDLGVLIGQLILWEIKKTDLKDEFLTSMFLPTPITAKRLRERGFNQSVEIVKGMSVNQLDDLLVRIKETEHQAKLDLESRLKNIKGVFALNSRFSQILPEKIIIVDDVITTGATMNEMAMILKKSGVKEVWGLGFAHGQ